MRGVTRAVAVAALLVSVCPAGAAETSPFKECWRSSFREQLAGPVRSKTNLGGGSTQKDFISTYEGDFRWSGDPVSTPVDLGYVYCFRRLEQQGGILLTGSNAIEMLRSGGGDRSVMGREVAVMRDPDVFSSLYARFSPPGAPAIVMEVLLDRQARTTTLTVLTKDRKAPVLSVMKGDAVQVDPASLAK